MRSFAFASLLVALSFIVTAQGQEKDSFDSLTGAIIKQLGKVADTLASITDKKTAEAAKPKLSEVGKTIQDLQARLEKLGKPSEEEAKALEKKYKDDTLKIISRVQSEAVRLATVEGGTDILKEIGTIFNKKKDKK
jgi:hypothetical protein